MSTAKQPSPGPAPDRSREARRGPRPTDARRDPGKLRENQARLGVGPEHKTDSMKRGRRGTFP